MKSTSLALLTALLAAFALGTFSLGIALDDAPQSPQAKSNAETKTADDQTPPGLVKLSKTSDIWLDTKRKAVVVDGQVCLREGLLEMFACPKGTKEHESVVSLNCQAEEVHAGLLAAGAKPGSPVTFNPDYKPATGQIIDIYVLWKDDQGKTQQTRAQDWIKDTKTGKPMTYDWVFAGSGFFKDQETGKEYYRANSGDLVCVSNFPTATLDLPVQSSDSNDNLQFIPFTDHVPPRGTKVRVVFLPRPEQKAGVAK
jgi:hypothetical protein